MRLRLRKPRDKLHSESLFSQSSNRSIVVETFDKQQPSRQSPKRNCLPSRPSSESRTIQYQSFEKRLKCYKQNLIGLIEHSKNQKEKYMKRIIDIADESRSKVNISRSRNYSVVSRISQNKSTLEQRETEFKPSHLMRPCKSPLMAQNNSQNSMCTNRPKLKQKPATNRPVKSSCRGPNTVVTPKQMGATQEMLQRRGGLEAELRQLDKNILARRRVKSRLL